MPSQGTTWGNFFKAKLHLCVEMPRNKPGPTLSILVQLLTLFMSVLPNAIALSYYHLCPHPPPLHNVSLFRTC